MSPMENITLPEDPFSLPNEQPLVDEKQRGDKEMNAALPHPEDLFSLPNEQPLVDEKPSEEKEMNAALSQFLQKLQASPDAETKLHHAIEFMRESISQSGNPQFKNFWEARKHCLELFKENIAPGVRVLLWSRYRELSMEARRLKDILDEQAAFAAEQIDVAIQALEKEITTHKEPLTQLQSIEFPQPCNSLEQRYQEYNQRQSELNLLNAHASRINALRKELIKTEMRIRQKNKFFKRLSAAGDAVFPRRKELIKEISQLFIGDVDHFAERCLADQEIAFSLFFYREEIKALQSVAKVLTLNTHAFTSTRAKLSECWDKIKLLEKDRKKEQAQLRQTFKEHADAIQAKIDAFSITYSTGELSTAEAQKQLDAISGEMRNVQLGRYEIAHLRDALNAARKPLLEKIKEKENERLKEEVAKVRRHQDQIEAINTRAENLKKGIEGYSAAQLTQERDALQQEINQLRLSKSEKLELERLLKPLRDLITDKKEQALLTLSDDDRQTLSQMREVLVQRKERRQGIRNQLELLRRAKGHSGLDFEQAMSQSELINAEKERLDKANQGILEVEQKIAALQKRIA